MKVKKELNKEFIIKEFQAGTSVDAMSCMYETSKPRIRKVLTDAGIDPLSRKKKWKSGYFDVSEQSNWNSRYGDRGV